MQKREFQFEVFSAGYSKLCFLVFYCTKLLKFVNIHISVWAYTVQHMLYGTRTKPQT